MMFGQIMSESAVPPRKRRRPALSCVECRRRKVKCDRNVPCTQCTQSKSSSCTYKDGYPGPVDGHTADANPSVTPSVPQPSGNLGGAGLIVPVLCNNLTNNPAVDKNGPPSRTVPLFNDSHSASTTLYSPSVGSVEDSKSEHSVQALLDRVKNLEQRLANTISPGNQDPQWTSLSNSSPNKKFFGEANRIPVPELRGSVSKTRLFGQNHWMHSFEHFKRISLFRDKEGIDSVGAIQHEIKTTEIKTALEKCKTMARAAKAERPIQWHINPNFHDYIPSRETSDKLVNLYLRTFEATYRILHVPSFRREYEEYWSNPPSASTGFLVKLVLIMAIGTTFYQEADFHSLRTSAQQWVFSAQSWMSAPFEKGRLNLSGLQVHCLVLLARQTTSVGGDLVWISVGSLIRMAITMGFHRDPKYFPRMSVLHAELRRRLWATVLEMAVQSSFDSGNPPLLSCNDWDTQPPSNINDDEIDETTKDSPISKPSNVYTQTSIQIQLLKSLRKRLEIAKLIMDFRFEPSYDEVLQLGNEIMEFGREGLVLSQIAASSASPISTTLQRNLLDTPLRKVLLALHFPFAMKARLDPRFYFSRKMCLDSSITILTYPSASSPNTPSPRPSVFSEQDDDYTRLKLVSGGFFKEVLIYAAVNIVLELITQLEEESPLTRTEAGRMAREPLRGYVSYIVELSARRISLGENNIKGHLFLSAVLAQVDAMERGVDPDPMIAKAARDSAEGCLKLLKARIKKPPSSVVLDEEIVDVSMGAGMDFGTAVMDPEFTFEYLMPDANYNFDIQEPWLFEGWEEHHEW